MRIDKYLKVSRIIKRRTVAQQACQAGRIQINGKVAKPSDKVEVGDVLTIQLGEKTYTYEVLMVTEHATKAVSYTHLDVYKRQPSDRRRSAVISPDSKPP